MKFLALPTAIVICCFCCNISVFSQDKKYHGKKVLYVNSYHSGYDWSDGEQQGAESVFKKKNVEMKVVYMDTKNRSDEESCRQAGLRAKKIIDEFKPDVVIAADDNAFIYLVVPYFKNDSMPIVFCGYNWDMSEYGAPFNNTTGMIEIVLFEQLHNQLSKLAKGHKLGLIGYDAYHERKNVVYYQPYVKSGPIESVFVKDFAEWKKKFIELQNKSDMIIVASCAGIKDWDEKEARSFVYENIKVPTGTDMLGVVDLCVIGLLKSSQEQGEYAARTALTILDGKKPADIPVVTNKKGDLYLNLKLAGKLGIVFTPAMLKNAKEIIGME